MDEVVTKWGIGSGVGLFIIAGISQALVNGFINCNRSQRSLSGRIFPATIRGRA